MHMSENWSSGWREWYEAHKDDEESVIFAEFNKRQSAFDYQRFVDHYNNLSDEEWQQVVEDCAKKGYDIRCVWKYKEEVGGMFNPTFDIRRVYELESVLLYLDGASDFGCWTVSFPDDVERAKSVISAKYDSWGLPVSTYWRNLLWN